MPRTGTKRCGGVLVGVPMDIDEDGWETEGDVEQRMERALADCRSKGIPVSLLAIRIKLMLISLHRLKSSSSRTLEIRSAAHVSPARCLGASSDTDSKLTYL